MLGSCSAEKKKKVKLLRIAFADNRASMGIMDQNQIQSFFWK